jgi:hypothetical protein
VLKSYLTSVQEVSFQILSAEPNITTCHDAL